MNIGLIDVDGHNFPNLALMRLSAYYKARCDSVEPTDEQKRLARWVNMRAAFASCSFEEFTG